MIYLLLVIGFELYISSCFCASYRGLALSQLQRFFTVCSYFVHQHHCSKIRVLWNAHKHMQPCHVLDAPFQSQQPLVQLLSEVYACTSYSV